MLTRGKTLVERLVHLIGPVGIGIFFVALGIVLALGLRNAELNKKTLNQNRQILTLTQKVDLTAERLKDCTTPGGTCYAEGQRRTGEAVKMIAEASRAQLQQVLDQISLGFKALGVRESVLMQITRQIAPITGPASQIPPPPGVKVGPSPTPISVTPSAKPVPCKILLGLAPCVDLKIGSP